MKYAAITDPGSTNWTATSYEGAGRYLGMSAEAVRGLVRHHQLPVVRYGQRGRLILKRDLDAWLESRREGGRTRP